MKNRRVIVEELVSYDVLLKDLERIMSKSTMKQPVETQCSAIELYTIGETAKIFKVSQRTLSNWGKSKLLTPICIGRRVYFRKEAVMKLIEKNELK